mmetsp:Transcript_15245/g.24757  ORF Transcript_15245/g.24757 Transcript_15245/m.24757 type:complete len:91 (+) Transcript_15245:391-663(+)
MLSPSSLVGQSLDKGPSASGCFCSLYHSASNKASNTESNSLVEEGHIAHNPVWELLGEFIKDSTEIKAGLDGNFKSQRNIVQIQRYIALY